MPRRKFSKEQFGGIIIDIENIFTMAAYIRKIRRKATPEAP